MDSFHLRHAHHGRGRGRLSSPEHGAETDPRERERSSFSLDPLQEHILLHPNFACKQGGQEADQVVRGPSFDFEIEPSAFSRESGSKARRRSARGWTRRMMQSLVDEGMQGVMNKVVTEQKARSSSRVFTDTPTGLKQLRQSTSGVTGKKLGSVRLQPLVCSPVESGERQYPQLVVTPSTELPREGQELGARERQMDHGGDTEREVGGQMSRAFEHADTQKCTEGVEGGQSTREGDFTTPNTDQSDGCTLAQDEVCSELMSSVDLHKTTDAPSPNCQATPPDPAHSVLPYSHHKTTKAMPVVLFESQITVYPRFKSTADLYPSFACCEYFSSEMDIQGCLSSLLELELIREGKGPASPPAVEPSSGLARSEAVPSLGLALRPKQVSAPALETKSSLISPARRSKLIDQAAQIVKERRFRSLNLSEWENHPRAAEDTVLLISPSQSDILLKQAVETVRKRQTKPSAERCETDNSQDAGEVWGSSKQNGKETDSTTGVKKRGLHWNKSPTKDLSSGRKYGSLVPIQLQLTSSSCDHLRHAGQSHLPTSTFRLSSPPPEPNQRHHMSRIYPSQGTLLATTHTHSLHSNTVRSTQSTEVLST